MRIPPMPPRDERPAGDRCDVTLRDTFAAAALTGLLAGPAAGPAQTFQEFASEAYRLADAMLRERGNHPAKPDSSVDHDAAPAARADSDEARADKAAPSHRRDGTGDALSKAEIDALQHVVEDGRLTGSADYGRLRSLLVRLRPEWDGSDDAAESATTPPRNGALSGCETVPDPDSRVWETHRTPQPHATQSQGSVPCEGSVRVSRNANEPVAWAVMPANSDYCVTLSTRREAAQKAAERKVEVGEYATMDCIAVVPLYRQPQSTLTDAEREAVEWCVEMAVLHATDCEAEVAALRGLLERIG